MKKRYPIMVVALVLFASFACAVPISNTLNQSTEIVSGIIASFMQMLPAQTYKEVPYLTVVRVQNFSGTDFLDVQGVVETDFPAKEDMELWTFNVTPYFTDPAVTAAYPTVEDYVLTLTPGSVTSDANFVDGAYVLPLDVPDGTDAYVAIATWFTSTASFGHHDFNLLVDDGV